MLECRSKAQDSDSSLVSYENFSEILWSSGWVLGQVTCTKMAKKVLHWWRHSQKSTTLNRIFFFIAD